MTPRHEIPTHLEARAGAFWGPGVRGLLQAVVGLALAYGALTDLPLPLALRLGPAALVLLGTLLLALWRPRGRALEEWAFVLLRYHAAPRVSVWRPARREPPPRDRTREVVLRAPGALPAGPAAREGEAHVGA